jgi:hypothetical protein
MNTSTTDPTTETASTDTRAAARRWPLLVLAAPAVVSIWAGWVGLGQMAGFGLVHPLPGIADGFELNSAITLPVGVEAYSAYALGTWLAARPIPATARRFAAWSSLAALGLGLLGQVIYHLLTAHGYTRAPSVVVAGVACLPVLVLGAGATLHHLLGDTTEAAPAEETDTATVTAHVEPVADQADPAPRPAIEPAPAAVPRARRKPAGRKRGPAPRRLLGDYLTQARAQLEPGTEPSPAWCRQVTGCSAGTSVKLAAALRADPGPSGSRATPITTSQHIANDTDDEGEQAA